MEVKSKIRDNRLYIFLDGELDEHYAKSVKVTVDQIIDCNLTVRCVIFDFSKIRFMDSTGIGVLLGRYKKLKKYGIPSYVSNPSLQVNKILQISGIYDIMPKVCA